jgi:hypothetical protein
MAPRGIYTRMFPIPDPPRVVDNLEIILRRSNTQADKGISHLQRASSLPTESVKSFTSFDFDKEIDQSFSRSKSETNLCQVLTGPERPNIFRPAQHPSHPSPTIVVQNPVTYSTAFVSPFIPAYTVVFPNPPIVMATRYDPLVFPAQLHDLPQGYAQRIRIYDAEGDISAQQHLVKFNHFCELQDVDYDDAKMILFSKSFGGEEREWFRGLPAGSIHNVQEFETIFLGKWERKNNSLHLLTQYNNLRRGPNESVHDFSSRFKKTYNAIPTDVKPPPGAAKLHYADAFSSEFTLLLRERRSVSLDDMIEDAIEVEVNLTTSNKNKQKHETKRVKEEEPKASTSSSNSDAKIDSLVEVVKALVKLSTADKSQAKNQNEPQVRNPNFRRQQGPPIPQAMQRGPRNPNEQQIRPPFQENLVDEEFIEEPQEHIHQFGDDPDESDSFVTKDQHDNFVSQEDEGDQEPIGDESESSNTTYLNALSEFNRQYELRNKSVVVAPPKKVIQGQASTSQPTKIQPRKEVVQ